MNHIDYDLFINFVPYNCNKYKENKKLYDELKAFSLKFKIFIIIKQGANHGKSVGLHVVL